MFKFNYKVLIPIQNPPKAYVNALKRVGLTPVCDFSTFNVNDFCGLLLTGGGDVLPQLYRGNIPSQNVNMFRDFREIEILDLFTKKRLPVLGVCRGLQLINLFFGGTLKTVNEHLGHFEDSYHPVYCPQGGFLDGLTVVNSYHHQSVNTLCVNANEICYSQDGTVEGFKLYGNVLAVQFHPERLNFFAQDKVYGEFARLIKS